MRSWRRDTKCDCKTDWLWVRSPLEVMKYLLKFMLPFLCSGVEALSSANAVLFLKRNRQFSRKWGTECLNIRFPLPTLLCVGYSVKLVYLFNLLI